MPSWLERFERWLVHSRVRNPFHIFWLGLVKARGNHFNWSLGPHFTATRRFNRSLLACMRVCQQYSYLVKINRKVMFSLCLIPTRFDQGVFSCHWNTISTLNRYKIGMAISGAVRFWFALSSQNRYFCFSFVILLADRMSSQNSTVCFKWISGFDLHKWADTWWAILVVYMSSSMKKSYNWVINVAKEVQNWLLRANFGISPAKNCTKCLLGEKCRESLYIHSALKYTDDRDRNDSRAPGGAGLLGVCPLYLSGAQLLLRSLGGGQSHGVLGRGLRTPKNQAWVFTLDKTKNITTAW